jgi:hypothetical protein
VANRFVRRIKSGHIETVEELKSEFKEVAKLTHPDLRGDSDLPGAESEFVAARAEYEAALRDFEKHRFGACRESGVGGPSLARQPAGGAGASGCPLPDSAWLSLEVLLKRGFPKVGRHDKERLRYEYARWRFVQALGSSAGELFRPFEVEMLGMKASGSDTHTLAIRLLRDLIEYRYALLPAMRTHVVLSFGRLKADPRYGTAVRAFVSFLAAELGIGGELGSESRDRTP